MRGDARSFVSTSTNARLLSSTSPLVSSLARVTDRAFEGSTARHRRSHPSHRLDRRRARGPTPTESRDDRGTDKKYARPIDRSSRAFTATPPLDASPSSSSFIARALDRDHVRARRKNVPRRRETLNGAELRARDAGRGATRRRRRLGGDHDAGRGGDRRHHHCDARGFARGCDVSRRARARASAVMLDRWMGDARVDYDAWTRVWGLYREVSTRGS